MLINQLSNIGSLKNFRLIFAINGINIILFFNKEKLSSMLIYISFFNLFKKLENIKFNCIKVLNTLIKIAFPLRKKTINSFKII